MKVPFLALDRMHARCKDEMSRAFDDVYGAGQFILGSRLLAFEQSYAEFSRVRYCLGVGNGLDALILSLRALGIGPGDEVIVPSNSYIASFLAVSAVGALPVPVEPKLTTCNLDASLIEAAITPRTRAIMPVHLYGQACEMGRVLEIARSHSLYVVEDNAQSHGATFQDRITGSFGDVNATSFYPGKNLGALGDGGAITTDREDLYDKILRLRNYGSSRKYWNEIRGYNSRLDELQAAFLSIKLNYVNGWNLERQKIAAAYTENLKGIDELILPSVAPGATSVFHLYVIRTRRRDDLKTHLDKSGVGTLIHYPVPPHLQAAYADRGYRRGAFPIAEEIADTCLSLPIYPGLTDDNVELVCAAVRQFFRA